MSDFSFGPESVQSSFVTFQRGFPDQNSYTVSSIVAGVNLPESATAPEAVLHIIPEGSETPLFSRPMEKTEYSSLYSSAVTLSEKSTPTPKNITRPEGCVGSSPPPTEYPKFVQYQSVLKNEIYPSGLSPGKYQAVLEFYQVTDGSPEGTGWKPWSYGQSGLVAKKIGSSTSQFELEQQQVDLVSYVNATVAVTVTAVPARRAKPVDVRNLRNAAKEQTRLAVSSAKSALSDLGRLRIDESAPWCTSEVVYSNGLSARLEHTGTISYEKGEEYDNAVLTSDTPLNGSRSIAMRGGTIVVKVSTSSTRY